MSERLNVLVLGGTGEAVQLAERLADDARLRLITSLAGRTVSPAQPRGEMRSGGFGGIHGLERYLTDHGIDLLIDATHPFAARISANAVAACDAVGVPRLILGRTPWTRNSGDRWIEVNDVNAAAKAVVGLARRAFLTVGRQELDAFAAPSNVWFLVRLIDPPDRPLPLRDYRVAIGRGPFTVDAERRLLSEHHIEAVVAKNSGSTATYAKIAAARNSGLPVVMVRPPPPPPGEIVTSVDAAAAWVRHRINVGAPAAGCESAPDHRARCRESSSA